MRTISRDDARTFLVSHHGLARPRKERGARGVRAMLDALGCVQLDPLDPMGTNADLVALARVDGIAKGDVFAHAYPGQRSSTSRRSAACSRRARSRSTAIASRRPRGGGSAIASSACPPG